MGPDHHLLMNGIPTVSLTVFRLASMVPPFLNKALSEELRFRVDSQRARLEHHPTHTVPSPRRESFRRICRL